MLRIQHYELKVDTVEWVPRRYPLGVIIIRGLNHLIIVQTGAPPTLEYPPTDQCGGHSTPKLPAWSRGLRASGFTKILAGTPGSLVAVSWQMLSKLVSPRNSPFYLRHREVGQCQATVPLNKRLHAWELSRVFSEIYTTTLQPAPTSLMSKFR